MRSWSQILSVFMRGWNQPVSALRINNENPMKTANQWKEAFFNDLSKRLSKIDPYISARSSQKRTWALTGRYFLRRLIHSVLSFRVSFSFTMDLSDNEENTFLSQVELPNIQLPADDILGRHIFDKRYIRHYCAVNLVNCIVLRPPLLCS